MKKFLLSLFVWFVWIISFWYCQEITIINSVSTTVSPNGILNFYPWYCFRALGSSYWAVYDINWNLVSWQWNFPTNNNCMNFTWYLQNIYSNNRNIEYIDVSSIFPVCSTCPTCEDQYTSLQCQFIYNLIPVESVDINYCVWNWLCPNECGSWTDLSWDLQYSNLYINSILHPWEENIFIDIPDYIQWDYSVSTWEFNIYVWSWYDMDYMNSIIKINSYRPDSTDFTNIFVSGLTLIFPYIFVLLLIIFMWKLIKRVFK